MINDRSRTTRLASSERSMWLVRKVRWRRRRRRRKFRQWQEGEQDEALMKQGLCCGVMKPNVTFFGEKLEWCLSISCPQSKVVEYLPPNIPRILLSIGTLFVHQKMMVAHIFHACLLGNCGKRLVQFFHLSLSCVIIALTCLHILRRCCQSTYT